MSQQYLLPCSCGQKVRVETAQAGGRALCACGQMVPVPTLRGLKQLELAPDQVAETKSGWSATHGAVFSTGMTASLIAAVVFAVILVQYLRVAEFTTDQSTRINALEAHQIDHLSPADTVQVFRDWQDEGLGVPHTPGWIEARQVADTLKLQMAIAGGVAAIGVLVAVGAALVRPAAGKPIA
ncbi:MAG: hypothetical protein SFU86_08250 [Pirellulaceae bacterium]|nr:hypothetical protein [Pirellulaceae bacterium]